jgi:hypothetical protein
MFGKGGLGGVYPVVLPFLVVALAMLFGFCRAQHHERESLREELEQLQATIRQREKERDSALQELFLRFSEDGKLNKEKSLLFWFEIAMFVIAPVFLLSQSKVRNNPNALYGTCAGSDGIYGQSAECLDHGIPGEFRLLLHSQVDRIRADARNSYSCWGSVSLRGDLSGNSPQKHPGQKLDDQTPCRCLISGIHSGAPPLPREPPRQGGASRLVRNYEGIALTNRALYSDRSAAVRGSSSIRSGSRQWRVLCSAD